MSVIGIAAALESVLMDYIYNINCIQEEQQWTQNRAVGNTTPKLAEKEAMCPGLQEIEGGSRNGWIMVHEEEVQSMEEIH